jgi:tetratricopeptide (TPR) repeat protein
MIVRDEEACLGECLDSVKTLVDEIVVVDTGSQDDTLSIALRYGAKTHSLIWRDDFSEARNFSISQANGEWILVLDADEVVAKRDAVGIRQLIDAQDTDGFRFILRNYEKNLNLANLTLNPDDYEEGAGYPGFIPASLIRLFKNDPHIYFTGKVHESLDKSFFKHNKVAVETGIPIHHYGKVMKDRVRLKQKVYLKLGEDKILENPDDPMAYKGLADQYLELGMTGKALEVLNRGVAIFPEIVELRFNRGLALDRLNQPEKAKNEYLWALARKPDHAGACHNLGHIYFGENQIGSTIDVLNRGIASGVVHPAVFVLLGRAYDAAGEPEKALISFDRALEIQPNCPDANCYKAVIFLNRNMNAAALNALEREIEIDGNLAGAYNLLGQMSHELKDFESAVRFFKKVLTINPDNATAKAYLQRIRCNGRLNFSQ